MPSSRLNYIINFGRSFGGDCCLLNLQTICNARWISFGNAFCNDNDLRSILTMGGWAWVGAAFHSEDRVYGKVTTFPDGSANVSFTVSRNSFSTLCHSLRVWSIILSAILVLSQGNFIIGYGENYLYSEQLTWLSVQKCCLKHLVFSLSELNEMNNCQEVQTKIVRFSFSV